MTETDRRKELLEFVLRLKTFETSTSVMQGLPSILRDVSRAQSERLQQALSHHDLQAAWSWAGETLNGIDDSADWRYSVDSDGQATVDIFDNVDSPPGDSPFGDAEVSEDEPLATWMEDVTDKPAWALIAVVCMVLADYEEISE